MIDMAAPVIDTTADANYMSGMAVAAIAGFWLFVDIMRHLSFSGFDMTIRFIGLALIVMPAWIFIDPSTRYIGIWIALFFTLVMMYATFKRYRQPGLQMNNN